MAKRIEIDEAPEWVQELRENLRNAAILGLQSAGLRLVSHIQTTLESVRDERTGKGPPIDRGAYRAAWKVRKVAKGVIVENTLPYASIIEYGARGENISISRAMIQALTDWIMRKGLAGKRPRKSNTEGRIDFYQRAHGMAWAIAVSMKKTGIFNGGKGLGVLRKAMQDLPAIVNEEVTRELRRVK